MGFALVPKGKLSGCAAIRGGKAPYSPINGNLGAGRNLRE